MAFEDRIYNRNDSSSFGGVRLGFTPPTPMTIAIMAACFVVYILQQVSPLVQDYGCLTLSHALYQPWRFITYQYLHGSPGHIFFNLLAIYFFLPPLERLWGPRNALIFYTGGGVFGGLCYCVLAVMVPRITLLVGASGSVLACIGGCALLFPDMQVLLIVFPVSIRALAIILGLFYALTIVGTRELADAAHLGGLVYGFAAPHFVAPFFQRMQKSMHRRLVQRQMQMEKNDEELVDRILQKVHDSGMNSLSRSERKALKEATERQRQSEVARARRGM